MNFARFVSFAVAALALFPFSADAAGIPEGRRALLGKIQVFSNGAERTKECTACFSATNRDCVSLKEDGRIATSLPPGVLQLNRVECMNEARTQAESYIAKGVALRIDSREGVGTYFGDLQLTVAPGKGFMYLSKADDQYAASVTPFHQAQGKALGLKYVRNIPKAVTNPDDLPVVNESLEEKPRKLLTPGEERNRLKSIYFDAGVYYSSVSYSGGLAALDGQLKSATHYGATLDLGAFLPLTDHETLIGGGVRFTRDSYSDTGIEATMTILEIVVSYRYYLMGKIGDGFFVRGDIGFPRISSEVSSSTNPALSSAADSKFGLGFMLGGGYDFVVTRDLKIGAGLYFNSATANYATGAQSESWTATSWLFGAHVLF